MLDLIYCALVVLFFVISVLYVRALGNLKGADHE